VADYMLRFANGGALIVEAEDLADAKERALLMERHGARTWRLVAVSVKTGDGTWRCVETVPAVPELVGG
jgi:hypothetical protein